MEHGGKMSRAQRNVALQVCSCFLFFGPFVSFCGFTCYSIAVLLAKESFYNQLI
jgi:hypothetical protein